MITCHTDGSCRYNPHGEMGISYIIDSPGQETIKYAGYIPERNGNSSVVAEYKALEALLLKLIELKQTTRDVLIRTDCDLIYRQFNRGVKPRKGFYVQTAFDVARLVGRFSDLKIQWIPRSDNVEADSLAVLGRQGNSIQ